MHQPHLILLLLTLGVSTTTALKQGTQAPFPIAVLKLQKWGDIVIQLRPDAAPKTVSNFVYLARSGFYNDSCTLYRNEPKFVIQGGNLNDPSSSTVPLEYNLPNVQYSVGLARAADPDSGSSEFFINIVNNTAALAPSSNSDGYAVFGEVVEGFTLIKALEALPTNSSNPYGMHMFDHPPIIETIVIFE